MTKKDFSEAVAAQLRGIIAQKGITRTQVSERTGIPPRTLARYLNEPPQLSIDIINDMVNAIGADLGSIIDAAEKSINN